MAKEITPNTATIAENAPPLVVDSTAPVVLNSSDAVTPVVTPETDKPVAVTPAATPPTTMETPQPSVPVAPPVADVATVAPPVADPVHIVRPSNPFGPRPHFVKPVDPVPSAESESEAPATT